ncbi:hypothetical protein EZV62_020276 [Acer yangbiense]|uniref:Uncharacterized protein n=1 Tax=Acer yangbiense TaxID=1000413 RepID=A0A5C7HDG1_9ROSI|nr:hypothetical protein EZV62_020276 [Acer yangbiense]
MASTTTTSQFFLVVSIISLVACSSANGQLSTNFYATTCRLRLAMDRYCWMIRGASREKRMPVQTETLQGVSKSSTPLKLASKLPAVALLPVQTS